MLGALSAELREQLVAVSVVAPAQIKLELRKDRTVVWGDDTESERKSQVATALLKRAGSRDRRQRAERGDDSLTRPLSGHRGGNGVLCPRLRLRRIFAT